MKKTIAYLCFVVAIISTCLFIAGHYKMIWHSWFIATKEYYLVILPAITIYAFFLSNRLNFIENLIHELTHMLFAIVSLQKVSGLYVSAASGVVCTENSRKNALVTLSPYFFPLVTILFICFFTFVEFQYSKHIVIVSYIWFLAVLLKQLVKVPNEVLSTGFKGFFSLAILNFWISFLILSWCLFNEFDIKEILIMIYDGIKGTISQFKVV